jgi:hypothetical protein
MKKFVYGILILTVILTSAALAGAAETKMKPSAAELKKMSTFLSNFTELFFDNFDVKAEGPDGLAHLGAKDNMAKLINFGIMHNYLNNFKTRIAPDKTKKGSYSCFVVDGKHVAESVKKYFDLDVKHQSVNKEVTGYDYDGKLYHFETGDGEARYYADVKEVFKRNDGTLRMTGEMYNAEDNTDRPATLEAIAKPYKWDGKDTWAILELRTEWKN